MSLIIKGMEMPVACFDCPCMQDLSNIDEEYYICAAIEHAPEITDKNNGRLPKCPIVEVPTPHGDLVDRDDLTDEINRVTFAERYDYNVAYNIVTDAETIIEAEVSENGCI